MFPWNKKDISAKPEANASDLTTYYNAVHSIDTPVLEKGDYVMLKDHLIYKDEYGGCVKQSIAKDTSNVLGYVLVNGVDEGELRTRLYTRNDLVIAVPSSNCTRISIYVCDSRVFRKANNQEIPKVLQEFIADVPLSDPQPQQLVRLRKHVLLNREMSHEMTSFGSASTPLLSPLMVIKVEGHEITLVGMTEYYKPREITVDSRWNVIFT